MRKRDVLALAFVILALSLIIASLAYKSSHDDFTYSSWAKQAHYPTPCEMQSVESNDREATAFVCKGTHMAPTKDQRVAWQSYLIYVSCYKYHQQSDCQELQN